MDRAVLAVVLKEGTGPGQKVDELFPAELTDSLCELAVADLSVTGNVPDNANIVRGIDEDGACAFASHQFLKSNLGRRIAAVEVMPPKFPDVAGLTNLHPCL
jgi:hypothetical protein